MIKIFIISGFVYLHEAPIFKGSNYMRTYTIFYRLILSSVICHLAGNHVHMSGLMHNCGHIYAICIIAEALASLRINEGW